MAVVTYNCNGELVLQRSFMVPKRASELKYWYIAARKVIPAMPSWDEAKQHPAEITVASILINWTDDVGVVHSIVIDRKRQLL